MAITTQILLDTEKRYADRKHVHAQRDSLLKKVKWHSNMNTQNRVQYLQQLNTREQVNKRMNRLKPLVLNEFASYGQHENFADSDSVMDELLYERVLGQNDLMNINFLRKGFYVSATVGRIVMKNSLGGTVGYGTGFMVSPRLLMTNNHVLRDQKEAATSHVEFNYQVDSDGELLPTEKFSLDPAAFFFTDKTLDFSIVAVQLQSKNNVPLKQYGWNKLIEKEGKIMVGEYMNIIQHPAGRPKEMALRSNLLIDILEQHIHYQTDTEPGSSGSPVFNDQWEVVALHHSTVPKKDKNGNYLTRDGRIWKSSMGESEIAWLANEGVRVSRIMQRIKNIPVTGVARNLRNGIFEAEVPRYSDALSSGRENNNGYPGNGYHTGNGNGFYQSEQRQGYNGNGIHVTQEDGSTVYTVPVRIKLQVGDYQPVLNGNGKPNHPIHVVQEEPVDKPATAKGSAMLQAELTEVKRELEAAKSKKYYDSTQDKKDITRYYKGIALTGSKKKVYDTLSKLVTDTHTEEIPYRPSTQLYSWVDLQPNLKLRSIYSGKEFDPVNVIEEDFRQEARIIEYTENLMRESSALSDRELSEKIALFEAAAPFNCEHVVPQSWFAKEEPMRGDLHHLFTCEWGCNSFRGNTPYFDFEDFEEAIREECGKREGNKFEPGAGKGEVARAVLYFLLRYPGEINQTTTEYTADRIGILLDWHHANKVTLHEKHRNAAIFKKQGNRNPFIDKPELAKKVDFLEGLG